MSMLEQALTEALAAVTPQNVRNPSLRVIGKARNIYGSALGTL